MEYRARNHARRLLLRIVLALVAGLVWWLANRHAHADTQPAKTIQVHAGEIKFQPAAFRTASRLKGFQSTLNWPKGIP